mgnify:FL=1
MHYVKNIFLFLMILVALVFVVGLAAAAPINQGQIWNITGVPNDSAPAAWKASQFKVWGGSGKGLSVKPGGEEGFIDLNKPNFGRGGGGVDSQDWRKASVTISPEKNRPIRTIYVRVQDGVDYGDFVISAVGNTAIGKQKIAPLEIKNQGPKANGKNMYFAVSFHRPVDSATLTFSTKNETGRKKANGFQVEVLTTSYKDCPDDVIISSQSPQKATYKPSNGKKVGQHRVKDKASQKRSQRLSKSNSYHKEAKNGKGKQ